MLNSRIALMESLDVTTTLVPRTCRCATGPMLDAWSSYRMDLLLIGAEPWLQDAPSPPSSRYPFESSLNAPRLNRTSDPKLETSSRGNISEEPIWRSCLNLFLTCYRD